MINVYFDNQVKDHYKKLARVAYFLGKQDALSAEVHKSVTMDRSSIGVMIDHLQDMRKKNINSDDASYKIYSLIEELNGPNKLTRQLVLTSKADRATSILAERMEYYASKAADFKDVNIECN